MVTATIAMQSFAASNFALFSVAAREIALYSDLPPEFAERVELLVEDLVRNVANHGYQGAPGPLTMELLADESGIRVRLIDQAMPFDPTVQTVQDCGIQPSQSPANGLGIMLARNMCAEIRHTRSDNQNILVFLIKPRRIQPVS